MDSIWQWVTGLGGLLGFANTAFLVFDRLFRYRPIVSVTAVRPPGVEGEQPSLKLRVKNVAPFDIVVERFIVEPEVFSIAAGNSIRAIAEVLTGSDVPIILSPDSERLLVMVTRDRSKFLDSQIVKITTEWRRGQATWLRQVRVVTKTSLNDTDLRLQAAANSPRRP